MGFSEEDFLPEVEIITAEDYLKDALKSNIQLFI
jgi:peroxiredoxin family protein